MTDKDFQKTPEIEGKIQTEVKFFLYRCPYLPTDRNKICIFVEGVALVKIMNFEEYPSITTTVTARRLIFVGATDCMVAVNNNVIYLFVCR